MTRPRAVVVTSRLPWPLDDGGRIDLWQSVHACARDHEVTLVSMVEPGAEHRPPPEPLLALGIEVVQVPHQPLAPPLAALQGLIGPLPYPLARWRSHALTLELARRVAKLRPDVVWFNQLHTALGLDALPRSVHVLRQQNVEHVFLERVAVALGNGPRGAYARQQARRMRAVEARLCAACDLVLAVQDLEREALRALAPATRVETLPIGVDLARFRPRAPESPPLVLLNGSFGWAPNADGAHRFLTGGWPRLRSRIPGVRLRLAGKGLPAELAAAARAAGAEPVGYVDDMADELARAAVLVVPLWVGAGARVKIIEALGARVPVVSTAIGAEGLGMLPGTHYLGGENPEQLADAVEELLRDPARADILAQQGHQLARSRFSLEAATTQGAEWIAQAVHTRKAKG